MKVLGDRIIIDRINEEEKTDFGFTWTGQDVKEMRYQKGKVREVGNRVEVVKNGDTVYFDDGARVFDTSIEGEVITIIRESDVVVVID